MGELPDVRRALDTNLVFRCARFVAHWLKKNQLSSLFAISPEGTAENDPGCQSWVNWTTGECYWQSSKPNPVLSETADT